MSLLTPEQIAESLAVCSKTVIAWIQTGQLRAVNVSLNGGSKRPRYRVLPSDLDVFLAVRSTRQEPAKRSPRKRSPAFRQVLGKRPPVVPEYIK